MEEENNKTNFFVKLLLFIFIGFIIMYISKETGYYEYKAYNKTRLTKEAIKEFEKDINNGKNVLLKDYIIEGKNDYSNVFSRTGANMGSFIENAMNDGIKNTLKFLSALFYK